MPEFSPTPSPHPLPPAETISLYRDALLRDAPPEELVHLGRSLDPEEIAWLELFRAAQREPVPLDPAFVARLDRVVVAAPGPPPADPDPSAQGRFRLTSLACGPRPPPRPGLTPRSSARAIGVGPRQLVPHLATAALPPVLLLAGLYTVRPAAPPALRSRCSALWMGRCSFEFLWDSQGGGRRH